jgi:putative membrane protein
MSKIKWSNLWKGFAMGTTDLVPGVSGGTIALLLGIYDDFIRSISGIFSKRFWESLKFLIPIGLGMVIAIGVLSKLINYLLSSHTVPTMFFFVGLIGGIIPYLLKTSKFKQTFSIQHYILLLLGIVIIVVITLLNNGDKHAGETLSLNSGLIIKYFIAGMCASSAMLLPGISGSFMLLVFGVYGTVMFAISEFLSLNFAAVPVLLTVGLGIICGFLFSSKLIQYLLSYYTFLTYALIIGFVVGSLYAVFPGLPGTFITWIISIITLILGFIISYKLGKITADD